MIALVFLALPSMSTSQNEIKKVKILAWWEFVAPEVIKNLEKKGYGLEIVEYRSNEVALSKLLAKKVDFDVAIVSNWVLKILIKNNKVDTISLGKTGRQRNYFKFIKNFDKQFNCIPYLWATTAYAIDKSNSNLKNMDLFKLANLKKSGFKIGIIDDPVEFGAMALLSYDKGCAEKTTNGDFLNGLESCDFPSAKIIKNLVNPEDFRSSIQQSIGKKNALYGWHGEIGEIIEKFDYMDFVDADHPSVIGLDSVCILKKAKPAPYLVDFIAELTGPNLTKINSEKMQYFSGYQNQKINYSPKIQILFDKTIKKIQTKSPAVLSPPSQKVQEKINNWWQKVRYEID